MKKTIHRAADRGAANYGWLQARQSFSFGNWYDPNKINFGALRVLNDDIIAPSSGFPKHAHDNMEIITIPLSGVLEHEDSMGNKAQIQSGEIQVMSAGSGITHSEYNVSETEELRLFQLWIFSNKKNVTPRYGEIKIDQAATKNAIIQLVSPSEHDAGTWIHQNAWISMTTLEAGQSIKYPLHDLNNGVYAMIVSGEVQIGDEKLDTRDAIGIENVTEIEVNTIAESKILFIEVPMVF